MGEGDSLDTQRCPIPVVAADLRSGGFDDAHEIGHGGFGVVYRCTERALDRLVAVKVLTVELSDENRSRFFREQMTMGRLTGHPNIVNVLQVGTTESGQPYIVMPYHSQDSLESRIRRVGSLSLGETMRLGVKLAGAVETAHRLGILHRDIKPGNILLNDYGEPILTDFGIAHVAGGFKTATGIVTGSPAYTAPEVLAGDPPTPASDLYSLGATLFSALTGHAAFERRSGEQVVAQFLRITTQPVPDLREHGIDAEVSAVINHVMARAPDQRPATAADFGEQLRRIQLERGFPVDEMALRVDRGADRRDEQPTPAVRRPRSPARRGAKGNLPLELTSFVGRRHELAEAKNLLAGSRLLTLTGMGGVGKTRLALRVAANARRDYGDGVWLVELGELHNPTLLIDVVAAGLGVWNHSATPLAEVLKEFLESRELLLVLDNCEQVIDAVAELAATLLRSCAHLRLLATSREPIGIGGETVLRVPPLTTPAAHHEPSLRGRPRYDAITLFTERAAAAVPGFELNDDNKFAVAQICHRLDGLPLPIELAAARLRAMSPEQILQRLTDRYGLLTRGSRGAPSRQQTLRLSIGWSFGLCTASEQLVWGRLSVFAGSFELDAAEQVCGVDLAPAELIDVVTSLVDKSILIREESGSRPRFRLLETVREYGREKLVQTDENVTLLRRHRDWYQELILDAEANWISARQLELISRLRREQPNIREALNFCVSDDPAAGLRTAVALFSFWNSQGLISEGRRWLARFLAHHSGQPTLDQLKALYAASVFARLQGDLRAAEMLVAQGREIAGRTSDPMMHAVSAYADGLLSLFKGDLVPACEQMESALAVFGAHEDRTLETGALTTLGMAYELRGQTARAIKYHEQVLAIGDATGEAAMRSYSLWALSIAVWQQGDATRAVQLLEKALRLARQARFPRIAAYCLEVLAWIAGQAHDATRAAVLLGAAEELGRSVSSVLVVFSNLLVYHEDCEQQTCQVLGEKEFEKSRLKGHGLDLDAAVAYALGERTPLAPDPATGSAVKLTRRESQVAALIAEGMTNRAIAAKLVISERTAQGHVEHILMKLGFTSRAQVAAWAVEQRTEGGSRNNLRSNMF